jgi:four helix bundle protein
MNLAVQVHQAARLLPQEQKFELGREMRRSATSVPSNVAEEFNRHSRRAYRAHVAIALGSTGELETQPTGPGFVAIAQAGEDQTSPSQ